MKAIRELIRYLLPVWMGLALCTPLRAQQTFHGDLSGYTRAVEIALNRFYSLSVECVADPENRTGLIFGIEQNYLMPGGVYIPDFIRYDAKDAVTSYTNYIQSFVQAYGADPARAGGTIARLSSVRILGGEWTADGKGVLLNVTYRNEWMANGTLVYGGESQAVVCFPDFRDMVSCRFRQITPYGWGGQPVAEQPVEKPVQVSDTSVPPRPVTSQATLERAMDYLTSYDYPAAFQAFRQLSEQGVPEAWGFLGNLYLRGRGTPRDSVRADACYREVYKHDSPDCLYFRAVGYYTGLGGLPQSQIQAFKLAKRSADRGSSYGRVMLGLFYLRGVGTQQDFKKAMECFTQAAEEGNGMGYSYLSNCYRSGFAVKADFTKALEYGLKAAELGYGDFGYLSKAYGDGMGCKRDTVLQFNYAREGARINQPGAMVELGKWYYRRRQSDGNRSLAEKYLLRADSLYRMDGVGSGEGNRLLASLYFEGNRYAHREFIRSALENSLKSGSPRTAQTSWMLSEMYLHCFRDTVKARTYCEQAANNHSALGRAALGYYVLHGYGDGKPDPARAYRLLSADVQSGIVSAYAYRWLAECLYEGYGTEPDPERAKALLEEGCSKGAADCLLYVGYYCRLGIRGFDKDDARAERLFTEGLSDPGPSGQNCKVFLGEMHAKGLAARSDYAEAFRLCQDAMEHGSGAAADLIAEAYENGRYGKPKNLQQALHYYQIAVDLGYPQAGLDASRLQRAGQ